MNPQEYKEYVKNKQPKSNLLKNMIWAFIIGGLICLLGQWLTNWMMSIVQDKDKASAITSVILIALGCLLTAFGVYDKIAKYAGAGTLVPISGFANSVTAAAIEYKTEGWIMGVGNKMFTMAGAVIVYGVVVSVFVGLIKLIF